MGKQSREKKERREEVKTGEVREERKFESQTGFEKACLFVIRWGTYLVLFTPLVINLRFFFPFVNPKTVFFRILIEIILAAYIFLVISNKRYLPRINALTITVSLFLGIFILASFTGINLERSFWSTYERMTGIWTMLHLFAFFIILGSCFKKRKDWERILGVSVIAGVFLSIYILMGNEISTRGGGTIGNTSFMAAYLLFDIFFAIILFLSKRRGWQIFSGLSLAIMLPVLLTSTARGAIVSFFGGLFLLFLGYLIFSRKKALKRGALTIILILVIFAILSAVFQPAFVKDRIEEPLSKMEPRFVVWEKALKGFQERPILGWGPENFNVVFCKYFNPCMFLGTCGGEIWFDRTHNIVLDTLVNTGLLGLLSYLAIFGVAIFGLLRLLPKVVEGKNIFIPLGMIVLLVVYFFQNLLVFDMINTYLLFFLCLAFVYFLTEKRDQEQEIKTRPINPTLGSVIIVIMIFTLWFGNIQPLIASHYVVKTVTSPKIDDATLVSFQKSLNSLMNKYEAREQFAQKVTRASYQAEKGEEIIQKAFDLAESEMEKSIKENSLDFRTHLFLGEIYSNSYRFSGDLEKLFRAEEVLEKAVELSPTNQQSYWYLAELKLAQGKREEVIDLLKKALDLEPKIGYSHWYLGMAYQIMGQNQLAKEEVIEAGKRGIKWEEKMDYLKKVIDIYLALDDNAGLIPLYEQAIKIEPDNTQFLASLAATYANLGQFDKARETAEKIIEINPDLAPKVEEFLENLPQ